MCGRGKWGMYLIDAYMCHVPLCAPGVGQNYRAITSQPLHQPQLYLSKQVSIFHIIRLDILEEKVVFWNVKHRPEGLYFDPYNFLVSSLTFVKRFQRVKPDTHLTPRRAAQEAKTTPRLWTFWTNYVVSWWENDSAKALIKGWNWMLAGLANHDDNEENSKRLKTTEEFLFKSVL